MRFATRGIKSMNGSRHYLKELGLSIIELRLFLFLVWKLPYDGGGYGGKIGVSE